MIKKKFFICLLMLLFLISAQGLSAQAQSFSPSIIRDSEIESILQDWTKPLILAAGLDPAAVKIIIVQSDEINAFVAGGQNVFVYTGLIEKTKNPGELIGVVAHELGHIRGGHLVRMRDAMDNASYESIIGTVIGLGAAILTGQSGAAGTGMAASNSQAMRGFLSFSRAQESSADQSALYEFNQAHLNPTGFLTFMEKLEDQELLPETQQDQFVRNHPLTRDRIDAIRAGVAKSPYTTVAYPAAWTDQHDRMVAKLTAFIDPGKVAFTYDDRDHSIYARYARAIAAYRQNKVQDSLTLTDGLLKDEPDNPYFHELKGQMLMDYGRLAPAIIELNRAVTLKPDAPLIRILYAQALIANSDNGAKSADLQNAISQLTRIQQSESRTPQVQRLLATAYGYLGNEPEAQLHLAEEAVLQRRYKDAKHLAEIAAGRLKRGSQSWLRAQDILSYINVADKSKDKDQDNAIP